MVLRRPEAWGGALREPSPSLCSPRRPAPPLKGYPGFADRAVSVTAASLPFSPRSWWLQVLTALSDPRLCLAIVVPSGYLSLRTCNVALRARGGAAVIQPL